MNQSALHSDVSSQRITRWLWGAVLVLLVYSLIPALTRSHLEGFTYLTETMSVFVPDLEAAEPLWATNRTYLYLSRPGTIWAMAPFSALFPGAGYNVLMWVMMPIFFFGLITVTKLWSGASWLASFAALLLIPIALEAQFFLNDNVIATAFSLCGIALLLRSQHPWANLVAGGLLSIAVLCRLDQILMVPLFVVLGAVGAPSGRAASQRLLGLILGFVIIHFGMWIIESSAANLVNRVLAISAADALWARVDLPLQMQLKQDLATFLLAFTVGIPVIMASVVLAASRAFDAWTGVGSVVRREFVLPALLVIYPVAIYVVTLGKYYDPRGFMTMIPFFAPLAAMGLDRWLFRPLQESGLAVHPWVRRHGPVAACILVPFFVPGLPLPHDALAQEAESEYAPETVTGRVWQGAAWWRWQESYRQREARMDRLVAVSDGPSTPTMVVTTTWTDDRQFQHALFRAGFRPATGEYIACRAVAEAWESAEGNVVYNLRLHVPILDGWQYKGAAIHLTHGSDCLRNLSAAQRILTKSFGAVVSLPPPQITVERASDGFLRLSDDALDTLDAAAIETLLKVEGQTSNDAAEIARNILADVNAKLN